MDVQAAALGLHPGLTLADARARVPALRAVAHDAAADASWLTQLARGCWRWSPLVAMDPPDGILLDIGGCAHLFGDEVALIADAQNRLGKLGLTLRHGLGRTGDAARALARFGHPPGMDEAAAIRALPVAALRLEARADAALRRAGLKTVGDVLDRPAASIAARFGATAVRALARLSGAADCPMLPMPRVPPLAFDRRFAEPVARTETMLHHLAGLAREAAAAMAARGVGGRQYEALFFRTDGLVQSLVVQTSAPGRDVGLLMRLFRERLEALADPLDPGFGYDQLRLLVPQHQPLAEQQGHLLEEAADEATLSALIDRLTARHGPSTLRWLRSRDSHVPERAQRHGSEPGNMPWPVALAGEPPHRPTHLFEPPQRIEVLAEVPDGPPRRFRWRRTLHQVRLAEGPERIAPEWWRRKGGALHGGLSRDYYRVEDSDGRRFWLFRHGLYDESAAPDWYLHGLFA